jgi:hypothetical protein
MQVTQEYIDTLMAGVMKKAKHNREKIGYDADEKFAPVALVVGLKGEIAVTEMAWQTLREKHLKHAALAAAAKSEGATAIVLVNDVRWTNSDLFSDYFHLDKPGVMGLEEWQKEYVSILKGTYGGSIKELPRQLWGEAVCVSMKGPLFEPTMRMAHYQRGPNDTVVWLEEKRGEGYANPQINILPDWWTESEAEPS